MKIKTNVRAGAISTGFKPSTCHSRSASLL